MAYDRQKKLEKILKEVEKRKLVFFEQALTFGGISRETFYRFYPKGSKDYDKVSRALEKNKVFLKSAMQKKWFKSDNAYLQTNLYKLIGTKEELNRLSHRSLEIGNKDVQPIQIEVINNETKVTK